MLRPMIIIDPPRKKSPISASKKAKPLYNAPQRKPGDRVTPAINAKPPSTSITPNNMYFAAAVTMLDYSYPLKKTREGALCFSLIRV